jgi:hypothetical protein
MWWLVPIAVLALPILGLALLLLWSMAEVLLDRFHDDGDAWR